MFTTEIIGIRMYIHYESQKSICIVNDINKRDFTVFFPRPLPVEVISKIINVLQEIKDNYPISVGSIERQIRSL